MVRDRHRMLNRLVLSEGVEPSRPSGHSHLKAARLPLRHESMDNVTDVLTLQRQGLTLLKDYGNDW